MQALAVGDAWPGGLDSEHFNAGVLSLEPSMEDYANLFTSYYNHTTYKDQGAMEQARSHSLTLALN